MGLSCVGVLFIVVVISVVACSCLLPFLVYFVHCLLAACLYFSCVGGCRTALGYADRVEVFQDRLLALQ